MTPDEKHDTNIINTFNKNDCNCKLEKFLLQKVNIGYTNDTFHIIGYLAKPVTFVNKSLMNLTQDTSKRKIQL